MVLRKYLEGSVLQKIEQIGVERIVNFHFSNRNELGDEMQLILSVELMGRHSNVILYNADNNKIIDLLKRINPDENRTQMAIPSCTKFAQKAQLSFDRKLFVQQVVFAVEQQFFRFVILTSFKTSIFFHMNIG